MVTDGLEQTKARQGEALAVWSTHEMFLDSLFGQFRSLVLSTLLRRVATLCHS